MALREAVAREVISRDPSARVKLPKAGDGPGRALSVEELREVFAALAGSWVRVPALIALGTGLRPGEILSLRWSDVDLNTGSITVARTQTQGERGIEFAPPKTKGSRRSVGIGAHLIDVLKEHRCAQDEHVRRAAEVWRGTGLVICRGDGTPWTVSAMSHAWKRLVKGARFYDLRHAANSHILASGIAVVDASRRMGHTSSKMTLDVYGHVIPGHHDAAAEVADSLLVEALGE
jgi:integrase